MAVVFAQTLNGAATSAAGTTLTTGTGNFVAGQYLIAYAATRATGDQTPTYTISSNGSVTWTSLGFLTTPALTSSGVGITTQIWHGLITATASNRSVTVTSSASTTYRSLVVRNYSGVILPPTVVTAIGTSATSPIGPGAWTTQNANTGDAILFFVGMYSDGSTTPVYSTSTTRGTWSTGNINGTGTTAGNAIGIASQYKIVTGNGTQSAFYTNGSTAPRFWTTATLLLTGGQPTTGSASISLTASGTDDGIISYSVTASGEITLIATASPTAIYIAFPTTGSSSITLTASANATLVYPASADGSINLVGTASNSLVFSTTGTGSINLVGTASASLITTGAGSISISGSGTIQKISYATTSTGAISIDGLATANLFFATAGSGSLELAASGYGYIGGATINNRYRVGATIVERVRVGATMNPNKAPRVGSTIFARIRTGAGISNRQRTTSTITRRPR